MRNLFLLLFCTISFQVSAVNFFKLSADTINLSKNLSNNTFRSESKCSQLNIVTNDLNEIFKAKKFNLSDSTLNNIRVIIENRSKKDTLVNVIHNNEVLTIIINAPLKKEKESFFDKWNKKDSIKNAHRKANDFYHSNGIAMYLGINALAQNENVNNYNTDDYDLSPTGSRYFSFGFINSAVLTKGKKSKLKLEYGLNFSWYNFMLNSKDKVWSKNSEKIVFETYPKELYKSKLTVSYVDLSLMPYFSFKKQNIVQYLGFGGYMGYKIKSYSKIKEEATGNKSFVNDSFFLNDYRYGLSFQLGLKKLPKIFANFDLNPLFESSKGPNVSAFSFGIKLF